MRCTRRATGSSPDQGHSERLAPGPVPPAVAISAVAAVAAAHRACATWRNLRLEKRTRELRAARTRPGLSRPTPLLDTTTIVDGSDPRAFTPRALTDMRPRFAVPEWTTEQALVDGRSPARRSRRCTSLPADHSVPRQHGGLSLPSMTTTRPRPVANGCLGDARGARPG